MAETQQGEIRKHLHWSEQLAHDIISRHKEPYVISAGMTTSGPTHLGTVCEFLFPQAVVDALKFEGKKAHYYFVADVYDAFDSVPQIFEQYKQELEPHLGKPLTSVPDPTGKSKSFGDHFLDESKRAMEKFGAAPELIRATDLYAQGAFDKYAKLFLEREEEVKKIVAETSLREELPNWWSPIMPLCKGCGKIATTRVISHDGNTYEYACDRDVKYTKGCGYKGKNTISDRRYKLTWRLHWPAWMDHFGTVAEGAGVDHHTRGGSWDTLVEIFRKIFDKEPPIGYKFGFILFEGKKYSKSKGRGMGVAELLELLPPEIIKFMLLKPDLHENVDIVPKPENLLRTIDDYEKTLGTLALKTPLDALTRADRKKVLAAKLASESEARHGGQRGWKTPFFDLILYRQLQMGWDRIAEKTKDQASIDKLSPYLEKWEHRNFLPEEYSFAYSPQKAQGYSAEFFNRLTPDMDAVAIHNLVFETAKELGIKPAKLFEECYAALLSKPRGPKLGKLIDAIGVEKVKEGVS